MLPSKGYFSSFSCPYNDSGECLRPHCHYRHSKKDSSISCTNPVSVSNHSKVEEESNVTRLQGFETESVNALSHVNLQEDSNGNAVNKSIVADSTLENTKKDISEVPSYKPTPIAELNKRHIPVVYAPTKPTSILRKKEGKDSLLYLPKSISKNASSANTYIPSSSCSSNSYTYQPTKITIPECSINDCKMLLKENAFVSQEEKLLMLDRLVEEEFGSHAASITTCTTTTTTTTTTTSSSPTTITSISCTFNNNNNDNKKYDDKAKQKNDSLEKHPHSNETSNNVENNILKNVNIPSYHDLSDPKAKPINLSMTEVIGERPSEKLDVSPNRNGDILSNRNNKNDLCKNLQKNTSDNKSSMNDKIIKSANEAKSIKNHKNVQAKKHKSSYKSKCNKQSENTEDHSMLNKKSIDKDNSKLKRKHSSQSSLSKTVSTSNDESKIKNISSNKESNTKNKGSSNRNNEHYKHKNSSCNKVNDNHSKNKRSYTPKEEHNFKIKHSSSSNKSENHSKNSCAKDDNLTNKSENHSKTISAKDDSSSSKSENHSKTSSSKDDKAQNGNKKEKNKNKSSNYESKNDNHSRGSHKKCKKRRKDELLKSHRDQSNSPPPTKIIKVIISSDESDDLSEIELEKSSTNSSDVEEIVCNGETIIIDSSSNSSAFCMDDENNLTSTSLTSNSPPCSPPPAKQPRLDEDDRVFSSQSSLQSILCERWRKARESVLMKSSAPGKMKIAQVPNVESLLNAKNELFAKAKERSTKLPPAGSPAEEKRVSCEEYVPKPTSRIAHVPKEALAQYPVVKHDENLKVPLSIRQSYLNNLFDEYKKYLSNSEASQRALEKEVEICHRTSVVKTYQNACAVALLRIRKNKGKEHEEDKDERDKKRLSFTSESIPDFTHGWSLYKCFEKFILSEEDYRSNGFPLQLESYKNCGYIDKSARKFYKAPPNTSDNMRICAHCSKNYYVDDEGFPTEENNCFYHWGRLRRTRASGGITELYICCGGDVSSEPCSSGRYHVCSLYDEDCLEGFVTTPPLSSEKCIESAGIYALDCEMCFTTQGLDLTRCTVVNLDGEVVYDKYVLPDRPILDYCTRFSGMTEVLMRSAKLKLKDVQRDLLRFINEKTIIVGHSLENDFKALRIFHKSIVDTSVVFPHHYGPPFRRSLKHLAKEVLNLNIQEHETGHDSKEDANTCMQLMMSKIKEDAKGRKPRVIISLGSRGSQVVRS